MKKLAMALAANPGNTMQALADNTGISKASLHRIYSTKEKLQATFVERMRNVFAEIRRTIREPHEDSMEALGELVAIHCRNSTYVLLIGRDGKWKQQFFGRCWAASRDREKRGDSFMTGFFLSSIHCRRSSPRCF